MLKSAVTWNLEHPMHILYLYIQKLIINFILLDLYQKTIYLYNTYLTLNYNNKYSTYYIISNINNFITRYILSTHSITFCKHNKLKVNVEVITN